jgi:hypothetical protein
VEGGQSLSFGALTCDVTAGRGSDFAIRGGCRGARQDVRLVLNLGINSFQRGCVGTPVVGAEQQFPAPG